METRTSVQNGHRQHVLLLAHADGHLQIYADASVSIRAVNVPFAGFSAEAEQLAEEYVTLLLPQPYRDVYLPSCLRAVHTIRTVTPSDIVDRNWQLSFVRGCLEGGAE